MSTSTNYSNIKFGLHSNAERYSWAGYQLFVVLSSLIGDTLILAASFKKNAFKINKLIVIVIPHIAVSDLVNSISFALPIAISLLASSWVLGETMCKLQLYLTYFVNPVSMYLVAMLTTCKFLILRYPLRAASWCKNRAYKVCGCIWTAAFIGLIPKIAAD